MIGVWIAGAAMTRIGRRPEPLQDLMAEAALGALAAAELERPDALVVATMNPEEFVGDGNFASNVASHMGLAEVPAVRVETATPSGGPPRYLGGLPGGGRGARPHGPRRRRRADDPPADAPGLRDHRPLDRSLRALLRRHDAGAGGAGAPRAPGRREPRRARDGPGRGEEPRQRRAQPARALPAAGHAPGGPREPHGGRPAAPAPLLPALPRRRGGRAHGRRPARRAGARGG